MRADPPTAQGVRGLRRALPHHRRGLPEQDLAFLLGAVDGLAEIWIDLFRLG
jgi:hypothetical protein